MIRPLAPALFLLISLPHLLAADPWEWIAQIRYEDRQGKLITLLPEPLISRIKSGSDDFRITGHFVPVLAQPKPRQFLLVPDPSNCPFCGSDGYGPSLEIHARRALPDLPEGRQITVSGRLELSPQGDLRLTRARLEN